MSETFSDKPLTVAGVTIRPKQPWSPQYRSYVREQLRALGKADVPPEVVEDRYVAWYAHKHRISIEEARARLGL